MTLKSILKIGCLLVLVALVFTGLGPPKWQPRSGFGWRIDHFLGYVVLTFIFCIVWARPVVVAGALIVFALSLEALQALTTNRSSNAEAAFYSVCGVLVATLVADVSLRAWKRFQSWRAEGHNL